MLLLDELRLIPYQYSSDLVIVFVEAELLLLREGHLINQHSALLVLTLLNPLFDLVDHLLEVLLGPLRLLWVLRLRAGVVRLVQARDTVADQVTILYGRLKSS